MRMSITTSKKLRKMSEVPLDERRQILIELMTEKSRVVRERHGISGGTIQHIRFVHGRSSSGKYYHKNLLEGARIPFVEDVRRLRAQGMNSLVVSEKLGKPLAVVNAVWGKVDMYQYNNNGHKI